MKKSLWIVTGTSILLLLAVVALWFLSGKSLNSGDEGVISFLMDGEEIAVVDKNYILVQESATFPAVIRSSGQKPQEVKYSGVLLSDLLNQLDIDWTDRKQALVKGSDGYVTALSLKDLNGKNVYIAYAMNGADLKNKSQGGYGPYQLVIRNDSFSQRWCKYVSEIEIK